MVSSAKYRLNNNKRFQNYKKLLAAEILARKSVIRQTSFSPSSNLQLSQFRQTFWPAGNTADRPIRSQNYYKN